MDLVLDALDSPVEVYFDEWGIGHARATTVHDAFVAQGYLHARDRLWQMDAVRRQIAGRWSEWVGPQGLEADKLARRLDAAGASRRDFEAIGDEARDMLTAYADGVNAWIEHAATNDQLPHEYSLVGGAPERWQAWHCISAMRQRGYLMGSIWHKLWRAAALRHLPLDEVAKLRWDDGGNELLIVPQGERAERWTADLTQLGPAIDDLMALRDPSYTGGGSNNWCVSPQRTATGRPMVAGDPHRNFELPGMYAQQHIACDEFDLIGLTIPGCPGFPHFAHNENVAWGVTIAFMDLHDLFIEKTDGDTYLYKDEWLPMQRRTERIEIRGAKPVDIDVHTTYHGPLIVGDPQDGVALSVQSIQFAPTDYSLDCMLPMMRARTCEALFEATRGWGLVDHNLVAGDTSGTIGYRTRAIVPRRGPINGWLPVPGWSGDYEWDGVVPFEEMPHFVNPERGFLVTANNRVVDSDPEAGPYLSTDCHPPQRAERIQTRLGDLSQATIADMAAIHADAVSLHAPMFIDLAGRATPSTDQGRALVDLLAGWNGRMDADSTAATAYTDLRWEMARLLAERTGLAETTSSPYAAPPPGFAPVTEMWWTLATLLRDDDRSLLDGSTWEALASDALDAVGARGTPAPWGERHRVVFQHPLAGAFPDERSALNPAGQPIGGDNETVLASGAVAAGNSASMYGSVARYAFDVGSWDDSRWVVLAGTSGDPRSPHYVDQHETWARVEMLPMTYSWDTITGYPDRLTLSP
ncbi:penicillin acylase family protein [Cumulibacter manganitolerans]|uniref:penicillin acylase family protein n=1 Tax=Cumulibacter manganitolerans TaxID=1884992 RepID=UPI001296F83B|nr:penicillin acylase family protein [Cumulibacter manganitolerans]